MVLALDYLDSMMYSIVASGILSSVALWKLPYNASSGSVDESGKNTSRALAATIGLNGLYLFITGLAISLQWPFTIASGVYNILFGGVATMGGLVLLSFSTVLFLNKSLKPVSYFAAVLGVYLIVDAVAMLNYNLTSNPLLGALLYISVSVASFLSIPATHSDNKWLRRLFAIIALAYALAWLYFGANVTYGHLKPPAK